MTVVPLERTEHTRGAFMMSSTAAFEAYALFRICGVVAIGNATQQGMTDQVRAMQERHLQQHRAEIDSHRRQKEQHGDGVPHLETSVLASRDPGSPSPNRFELKLPASEWQRKTATQSLLTNRLLLSLIKTCLSGHQVNIDTFSYVVSLPGAGDQAWHRDVDHLFKHTLRGPATHTPPPGE